MKSMNVKRLVALGVAAAIAAVPVAHAAQTFNTSALPTDKSWYLDSVVVVGHASAPSDAVWAGNIAAAIANMAYTEETKTVSADIQNAKVKLSTPGEITIGGEGEEYKADYKIGADELWGETTTSVTVTKTDFTQLLENEKKTFQYKKGDEWKDMDYYLTETVVFDKLNVKPYLPENSDEGELRAYFDSGYKYEYHIKADGIDWDLSSTTYYDKDHLRGFEIPILGKTFKVVEVNYDASGDKFNKIVLTTSSTEAQLFIGDETEIEGGYKIKLVDVSENGNSALLQLTSPEGEIKNVTVDTSTTGEDFDFLPVQISVEEIFAGAYANQAYVKIGIKADTITVEDVDDETEKLAKEDFLADGWDLYIKPDVDSDKLKSIEFIVKYTGDDDDTWLSDETGLKVGDAAKLPGDLGWGIVFEGPEAKPMRTFEISGQTITTYDGEGRKRTAKLYAEDKSLTDDPDYTGYKVAKFTNLVDDIDIALYIDSDSVDYIKYNDRMVDISDVSLTALDNNATSPENKWKAGVIEVDTDNDGTPEMLYLVTVKYNSGTPVEVYMNFGGTKVNIDDVSDADADITGDISGTWSGDVPYQITLEGEYNAAETYDFKITALELSETDATLGKTFKMVPQLDDVEDGETDTDIEVGVMKDFDFSDDEIVYNPGGYNLKIDAESGDSDPENFLSEYGTEVAVESSSSVKFSVPTEKRQMKVFFGQVPQTIETENYIEAGVGETITIGDTEIKIEDITAEGATATYTEVKPIKLDRLVYLDNEVPSGKNLIVVGGYFVNSIAEAMAKEHPEIKDAVAAEKDYIVDKYTYNGKDAILVFGYTAEDTATAAQQFLNWLKSNVQ